MHRAHVRHSRFVVLASTIALAAVPAPRARAQQASPATPAAAVDTLPRFAADGTHIIFQTTRDDGTPHQHVIGVDGTDEHPIDTGPVGAVSPDGRTVIYSSRPAGRPTSGQPPRLQLLSSRADGSGDARVFSDLPLSQAPAWSPNGQVVAFTALAGPPPQGGRPDLAIYLVDAEGANRRRLRPDEPHPYELQPDWSPDGTKIALATVTFGDAAREPVLAVAAADGTGFHLLGVRGENPRWSIDGRSVLYWSVRGDKGAICAVGIDGTSERQLTNPPVGRDEVPRWSPDGRRITFQSTREGAMTIFVMNADGTGVRRVRR